MKTSAPPHRYLYAVYDNDGNYVKAYVNETWARRRAARYRNGKVEAFIHPTYRLGLELEGYTKRSDTHDGR